MIRKLSETNSSLETKCFFDVNAGMMEMWKNGTMRSPSTLQVNPCKSLVAGNPLFHYSIIPIFHII